MKVLELLSLLGPLSDDAAVLAYDTMSGEWVPARVAIRTHGSAAVVAVEPTGDQRAVTVEYLRHRKALKIGLTELEREEAINAAMEAER